MTCITDTPYTLVVPDYFTGRNTNATLTIVSSLSWRVTKESIKYNASLLRDSLYLDSNVSHANNIDTILAAARIVAWNNIDIMYSEENAIELCRINPLLRNYVLETSNNLAIIIQEHAANLLEFAKKEFELSAKQKDGSTLREHLESIKAQTGFSPPELENVNVSPTVMYLWTYFLQLNNARQNGMSVNPLSYSEIDSWQRLTATEISPFELSIIKALDNVFISHINSKDDGK